VGVLARLGRPDFFNPQNVPLGAFELDRTHPLARGLVAAWIPGSIYRWRNMVGVPYSETPTSIKYAVGPRSAVADFGSVTSTGGVSTSFNTALTDFTIEASIYIPALTGWNRIADKKYDTGFWFGRIGATGDWGGGIKQLTYPNGQGITITQSAWHQLVMSRAGSTQEVASDGNAVSGSWACDGTALDTTAMKIGYNSGADEVFTGLMERLFLWNRALSAGERLWLYREPYAMFRPVVRRIWSTSASTPTNITLTQVPWLWTGNAPGVNQKQAITASQKSWAWAATAANVNAKTMISATQTPWVWTGRAPGANQRQAVTPTQVAWQWTANAASVSASVTITAAQAAWVWAGNAPGIAYIQHAAIETAAWLWRARSLVSSGGTGGMMRGVLVGILRGVMQRRFGSPGSPNDSAGPSAPDGSDDA